MQAVIMAGGKGTRLYPYSALFPKPLMPLGEMPILELLLRRFKNAGIEEAYLAVNHLSRLIEAYFGDGAGLGMHLHYRHEDKPLGTAGALGAMIDELEDDFIVSNGDLLTTLDVGRMARFHAEKSADATVGVFEREVKIDFGLIELDDQCRMQAYHEKPTTRHFVSMGLYVLNRDAVRPHLRKNEYLDMPNLLQAIRDNGGDVRCYHEECTWLDIGRPEDFARAQEMFRDDRELFLGRPERRLALAD